VLGQEAVDEKSNEIVAIPLLLERLELTGARITIDAIGTQIDIAERIVKRGGDYLLALKAIRPALHDDVARFFDRIAPPVETTDGDHGRIEIRGHVVRHASSLAEERY
jgi:predicted transposase YbfD/YdcC